MTTLEAAANPHTSTDASSPADHAPSAPRFYHPELDGLRFVAFLAVFFHHIFPTYPAKLDNPVAEELLLWLCSLNRAGSAGVDLFFVLSSYLITQLLMRERETSGAIDIKSFYVRRILRIWPLYYAMLLFAWLGEHWVFGKGGMPNDYALAYALFVGNWAVGWWGGHPFSTALILWTVSIEEQFYVVWPWIVRWLDRRRLIAVLICMLIAASVIRFSLVVMKASHWVIEFNTFTRMDGIAAGALLSLLMGKSTARLSRPARYAICISAAVAVVVINRVVLYRFSATLADLVVFPVWSAAATAIVWATLQPLGQSRGILTWRPMVYFGRISYGLYVLHFLCAAIVLVWVVPLFHSNLARLLALPLTMVAATLSYFLLERPFLQLKLRFTHVASRPGG